jgi:tRNA-binding EMAP/Myf-like protein
MSERKLAHIERVVKVEPIPGADKVEKVTVLGWEVVCRKGEVKEGQLCVYIEVDSVVPDIPYFDFMAQHKFRVKTIKLRGQVSQGLIVPINDFSNIAMVLNLYGFSINASSIKNPKLKTNRSFDEHQTWKEGQDVTDWLCITKWLSPSERESNIGCQSRKKHNFFIRYMTRFSWFRKLFHKKSKSFPEWLKKTDEERIQNIPWVLKDQWNDWYTTEKLDGQSATYWIKKKLIGYEFGICSRTVRKFEHDNSNWSQVAKKLNIKQILIDIYKNYGEELAIQGEIIGVNNKGSNIQGNKYELEDTQFYIFNVFNVKEKKYKIGRAHV